MAANSNPAAPDRQQSGFTQVPNHIIYASDLSYGAKTLYTILLSYCWQKDTCFPSYERLMADMHCHSQALSSFLKELYTHGLITIIRRGQGKTNLYQLNAVVQPAAEPNQTQQEQQPETREGETDTCSLKIKEQDLRISKREKYSSNENEDRFHSNSRIADREDDYVNFQHPEQGSKEDLKPEGSYGGAVQPSHAVNHRNIENIETKKNTPPPAKPKSSQAKHVPQTARPASKDTAIQTAIQGYIRDAACKLHDEAPLKSSTTRAYNLYLRSGIQLNSFFDTLYDAEQETQRRSATITKLTEHGFKNRMAYFFAVLEDKLGLRQQSNIPCASR